jgi:hypothetical protein
LPSLDCITDPEGRTPPGAKVALGENGDARTSSFVLRTHHPFLSGYSAWSVRPNCTDRE